MPERLNHCLLCGNSDLRKDEYASYTLNLSEIHGVTECLSCGFRFLNPRPTQKEYQQAYISGTGSLIEMYRIKDDLYGDESLLRTSQFKRKLDILKKAGAKGRLLELGSCTGTFLNEARSEGFEVVGIEPGENNCRIAKQKYDLDLYKGGVEDYEFDEDSFDVVFSCHVFEHLLDPLGVAKKISKWLRPGGFHMVEVPNQFDRFEFRWWRLRHVRIPSQRSFLSIHHPLFFSYRSLKLMMKNSGCRVYYKRNVYYPSQSVVQKTPKAALSKFMALFFGSLNIEITGRKE